MKNVFNAEMAIRMSSVAAAGVTADGRGFIRFTCGGVETISPDDARCIAGALSSGVEMFSVRTATLNSEARR